MLHVDLTLNWLEVPGQVEPRNFVKQQGCDARLGPEALRLRSESMCSAQAPGRGANLQLVTARLTIRSLARNSSLIAGAATQISKSSKGPGPVPVCCLKLRRRISTVPTDSEYGNFIH